MVRGIKSFREWFRGYEEQYAIIGGTACDLLMTEEGLDFRATKDIDLVLIIESVDASFGSRFSLSIIVSRLSVNSHHHVVVSNMSTFFEDCFKHIFVSWNNIRICINI